MDNPWGCLIAGVLASLITLLELDRIFYVPKEVGPRSKLYALVGGFLVVNGLLAAGLYAVIGDLESFKQQVSSWMLRAVLIGISYLALIRLKIATVEIQENKYSVGIEALYEGLKNFFYKRINSIIKEARHQETTVLAENQTLEQLSSTARNYIRTNDLLSGEKKKTLTAWVQRVEKDTTSLELDRKLTIANFILSDRADGAE